MRCYERSDWRRKGIATLPKVRRLAQKVRRVYGDEPVLVLCLAGGVIKVVNEYFAALDEAGVSYKFRYIQHGRNPSVKRNGGVRPIISSPSSVYNPGFRSALIFDDDVTYGVTTAGATVWVLENAEELGITSVRTMVDNDGQGIANFCRRDYYDHFPGMGNIINFFDSARYRELEAGGKLDILDDTLYYGNPDLVGTKPGFINWDED